MPRGKVKHSLGKPVLLIQSHLSQKLRKTNISLFRPKEKFR